MDWADSSAAAEAEIVGLRTELEQTESRLMDCVRRELRLKELLDTYPNDVSLVAIGRVKKAMGWEA